MGNCNCLVLAAGKSTRISSIANGKPKPLIKIAGESILSRNLRWLSSFGVKEASINLHFQPDMIQRNMGNGKQFNIRLHYIIESEILGTAGALRNAQNYWNHRKAVLVVYGDNLFNFNLEKFYQFHNQHHSKISIALFDQNNNPHTGIAGGHVIIDDNNLVQRFEENGSNTNSSLVNAGAYIIEPEIIDQIPENTFYDFGKNLFPKLLSRPIEIFAYTIKGYCLGLDTPESFHNAELLIQNKKVGLL